MELLEQSIEMNSLIYFMLLVPSLGLTALCWGLRIAHLQPFYSVNGLEKAEVSFCEAD